MKRRMPSLDALRGFDMLMIMGFGPLVISVCAALGWGTDCALAQQFEHVEWNGLRFEDTIFPLFLFLAGVSWPFSCAKQRERGTATRAIGRRIKKLGYNWKEEGVGKIARIVLKLFASESEWEDYWRKRMDLNQSVMLNFKVLEVR